MVLVSVFLMWEGHQGGRRDCRALSTLSCHSTVLCAFYIPPPEGTDSSVEQALCIPELQMEKLRHTEVSNLAEVLRLGGRCRA